MDSAAPIKIQAWREATLRYLLAVFAAVGTANAVFLWPTLWVRGQRAALGLVMGLWGLLVVGATFRKLSYRFRAFTLFLVLLVSSAASLTMRGMAGGNSLLTAFAALVLAGILLGVRGAAWVAFVTVALHVAIAAMAANGVPLPLTASPVVPSQAWYWIGPLWFAVVMATITIIPVLYLQRRLVDGFREQTRLVQELKSEVQERVKAMHALEAAQSRLVQSQKMQAIGQLAAGLAHDFNNTLTVLLAYTDLLQRDERHKRSADAMMEAIDQACGLTRQLLVLGREQSENVRVLDPGKEMHTLAGALRRLLPPAIRLHTQVDAVGARVRGNGGQIQQALLNLALNARDAMPDGGDLSIRVGLVDHPGNAELPEGTYVEFAVSDTGSGIDDTLLPRIFEPMFTTKSVGQGTGLGLASVQRIAGLHGGAVFVDSKVGQGSVFRILLPPTHERSESCENRIAPAASGRETILVAGTEARVRKAMCSALESQGYRVIEAHDMEQAIKCAADMSQHVHALCLDLSQPEQDRAVVRHFIELRPAAGVVLCSSPFGAESIQDAFGAKILLLSKPFGTGELALAVRRALVAREDACLLGSA